MGMLKICQAPDKCDEEKHKSVMGSDGIVRMFCAKGSIMAPPFETWWHDPTEDVWPKAAFQMNWAGRNPDDGTHSRYRNNMTRTEVLDMEATLLAVRGDALAPWLVPNRVVAKTTGVDQEPFVKLIVEWLKNTPWRAQWTVKQEVFRKYIVVELTTAVSTSTFHTTTLTITLKFEVIPMDHLVNNLYALVNVDMREDGAPSVENFWSNNIDTVPPSSAGTHSRGGAADTSVPTYVPTFRDPIEGVYRGDTVYRAPSGMRYTDGTGNYPAKRWTEEEWDRLLNGISDQPAVAEVKPQKYRGPAITLSEYDIKGWDRGPFT